MTENIKGMKQLAAENEALAKEVKRLKIMLRRAYLQIRIDMISSHVQRTGDDWAASTEAIDKFLGMK